jgi:hypothetical protein
MTFYVWLAISAVSLALCDDYSFIRPNVARGNSDVASPCTGMTAYL